MADGNITVEVSTQAAQAELERLRAENAALKHDLQYARDGLTRGRTRMREDNERLAVALRDLLAAHAMRASCQAGVVERCKCAPCATARAREALGLNVRAETPTPAPRT